MTSNSGVVAADKITSDEFNQLLSQYPALVKAISDSKGGKNGQQTLQELDAYRYGEALEIFCAKKPQRAMELNDVKELVEWKLRHGKFRPTLMKFVTSNDPTAAKEIIQEALEVYQEKSDAQAALDILTKLKGIGPATASLLLTVHDPDEVIFFSDEAFYWLCCDRKKTPIKYNAKEYQSLRSSAKHLAKRLDVSATEIEKVAYVLLKQAEPSKKSQKSSTAAKVPAPSKARAPSKASKPKPAPVSAKRKAEPKPERPAEDNGTIPPLRRSKRTRT
ncbi:Fc.00g016650.m01.CDS01 [Cosmosporella sp. VM-42]